jgi:hypothetical protein
LGGALDGGVGVIAGIVPTVGVEHGVEVVKLHV